MISVRFDTLFLLVYMYMHSVPDTQANKFRKIAKELYNYLINYTKQSLCAAPGDYDRFSTDLSA